MTLLRQCLITTLTSQRLTPPVKPHHPDTDVSWGVKYLLSPEASSDYDKSAKVLPIAIAGWAEYKNLQRFISDLMSRLYRMEVKLVKLDGQDEAAYEEDSDERSAKRKKLDAGRPISQRCSHCTELPRTRESLQGVTYLMNFNIALTKKF